MNYCWVILIISFFPINNTQFIVTPSNTDAVVGYNVTMYCSTINGVCEWYHLPIGAIIHEIVYQGGYVYNRYNGIISVNLTNGACNLHIKNVSTIDAGLYTCMETTRSQAQTTAELVVFEKIPSDKTCIKTITCAPTCTVELSCTLKSYGNLIPIMEWRYNGTLMNSTLNEDKTISTVQIKELQPLNYSCLVKYSDNAYSKFIWFYRSISNISSVTPQYEQNYVPFNNFLVTVIVIAIIVITVIFLIYITTKSTYYSLTDLEKGV